MELMINDSCHVTYKNLSYNNDFSHVEETNYFQAETNTNIIYSNSIGLVIYLEKFKYSLSKEENMLLHLPDVSTKKSISIYKDIITMYFHFFLEIEPTKISISHEHNINNGMCYLNVCVSVRNLFTKIIEPFQFVVRDIKHPFLMNSLFLVMRIKEKYNGAITDFISERQKENGLKYFVFDGDNDFMDDNENNIDINDNEKKAVDNNKKEVDEDNKIEETENNYLHSNEINVNNNKTPVKIGQRHIESYFVSQKKEDKSEGEKEYLKNTQIESNENNCNEKCDNIMNNNEINKDLNITNQITINETNKKDLLELSQPDVIINDSFPTNISKIQNCTLITSANLSICPSKELILTQYPLISRWNSHYVIPKGLRRKKILFLYTSQSSINLSNIIYQLIPKKHTLQIKQNFNKKPKRINSTHIKYIYFRNITHFPDQIDTFIKNTIIQNINSTNNSSFCNNKNIKIPFKEFFYNFYYPCIVTTTNLNLIKLCYSSPLVKSLSFFQEIPNTPLSTSDTNSFNEIENDFNPSLINEMNKTQLLHNTYIIN